MSKKGPKKPKLRVAASNLGRNPSGHSKSKLSTAKLGTAKPEELIEWAKSGEREAFDELVRRTQNDAYGLALRLTGNIEDAKDAVQDAYIRAYRSLKRFRGDASFSTWLYRIVANCAFSQGKSKQRHRHDELPDESMLAEERADHDPAARADAVELRAELEAAIAELPERLRMVVVMRDIYDLPHEAIAEEMGISVNAAKVRLHRARRRLREQFFPFSQNGQDGRDVGDGRDVRNKKVERHAI